MARVRTQDFLQNHRFWLMDLVPSATYPFLVLGPPLLGFQSITMPEYTAEVEEIKQLNSMYKKHVYNGGGMSSITLTRGVLGYDNSFNDWMNRAIRGNDMTNRNLLLIHFTGINSDGINDRFFGLSDELPSEPWEERSFLPGKVYLLWDCIPSRYKPGSDFDALGGQVSIAELELQIWAMTELSLLSSGGGAKTSIGGSSGASQLNTVIR